MDLPAFRALLGPAGQQVLASLPPYDEQRALAVGARLRERHPPELVAAALTQARLRARARGKFGPLADRLYFTAEGLEQATRAPVAALRAERFAAAGLGRVADLGCGVGGDLLALAGALGTAGDPADPGALDLDGLAGLPDPDREVAVLGVDLDPLTAAVAEANAAAAGLADVQVACADVIRVDLRGQDGAFCDPARRAGGARRFDPRAWSPPYDWVLGLPDRVRTGAAAAKVAPGIPHALVPAQAEAQWVSDGGDVVEAVLWWGPLRTGARRRATLLPSGATLTDEGLAAAPVRPPARYLYEPDGAVIRAGLVAAVAAQVGGGLLDETIAYLTADALVPTPYATAYEVTDVLAFSVKRLRALLRSRGVGTVVVKKRGSAVEPEALRRQLRLSGPNCAVVVLTRVASAPTVLLARPADPPQQDHRG